jgi:peptidyl-prolyl cis-trans isomerase C
MSGCGTGSCSCGGGAGASAAPTIEEEFKLPVLEMPAVGRAANEVAGINGVPLHEPGKRPDEEALRQRACTELLRQAAQRAGLLAVGDAPATDGTTTPAASDAIEQLLEQELAIPAPSEDACRRHYGARQSDYAVGEKVSARHILYAVTPGIEVQALRRRAEAKLVELRCAEPGSDAFATAAGAESNCPSGAAGGDLGWLGRTDCAPEFASALFGGTEIGVLPRLIATRFGLHIVEVLARDSGQIRPFEEVREAVALRLRQQVWVGALRQYLQLLAGDAAIEGVALDVAATPLVQ